MLVNVLRGPPGADLSSLPCRQLGGGGAVWGDDPEDLNLHAGMRGLRPAPAQGRALPEQTGAVSFGGGGGYKVSAHASPSQKHRAAATPSGLGGGAAAATNRPFMASYTSADTAS